ncbi:MAG: ABC transporter ATP-binding protein [Eubacteriales bacterium]|nr:ABC transporter ATP-binding protein [Eubacteriales bacterium]
MFALNRKFTLLDSVRIPLEVSPGWTGAYLASVLAAALVPAAQVTAVAGFVSAVGLHLGGASGAEILAAPAVFLFVLLAIGQCMPPLQNLLRLRLDAALRRTVRLAYFDRLAALEYRHIESDAVRELISRLFMQREHADCFDECIAETFQHTLTLAKIAVQIVSLLAVVIRYSPWVGIGLTAVMLPLCLLSGKIGEKDYDLAAKFRKNSITSANLGQILLLRPWAMERFLFAFSEKLNRKWAQNYRVIARNMVKITMHEMRTVLLCAFAGTFFGMASILAMAGLTVYGKMELTVFLPLVTGVLSLCAALGSDELSDGAYFLATDRRFYADLSEFAALSTADERRGFADTGDFGRIEFRNVRFRYPGTENYILDGVNLVIERGRHYAFVGINGAGKTTVTKLLLGLYDDYEGEILLDGRELREYSREARQKLFSAVFQDFVRYEIPLDENVRLGKPDASEAEIAEALETVGLRERAETLPQRLHTLLGKLRPGGIDLSGGEWQRVAMARCAVKPAPVKILDEPTAALDPIAESRVYRHFGELSRGATTIFISHRLGSTRLADVIYVLDHGRVSEYGSHDALMANRGVYYEMYESQRSWYQ